MVVTEGSFSVIAPCFVFFLSYTDVCFVFFCALKRCVFSLKKKKRKKEVQQGKMVPMFPINIGDLGSF